MARPRKAAELWEKKEGGKKLKAESTCTICGPITIEHKNATGHASQLKNQHRLALNGKQKLQKLSADQREALQCLTKLDAHNGIGWWETDAYGKALHCPGRVFLILLIHLASNKSLYLNYTTAALFKWASMAANGKKVDLLNVPPAVEARKGIEAFSDDEVSPKCRSKKKAKVETEATTPNSKHIVGLPSSSADNLYSWLSPGPAVQIVLPARNEGDADPQEWVSSTLKVPAPLLGDVYSVLTYMAADERSSVGEVMEWKLIPVPLTKVPGIYKQLGTLAVSSFSVSPNSQSTAPPRHVDMQYSLPRCRLAEFTRKVLPIISPNEVASGLLNKELQDIFAACKVTEETKASFETLKICTVCELRDIMGLSLADLLTAGVKISLLEFARLKAAVEKFTAAIL